MLIRRLLSFLKFLLSSILELLEAVSYKWVLVLIDIFRGIGQQFRVMRTRGRLEHFRKNATLTGCGTVRHPSFHRPDPLIYSQNYLLSLGLAATWDNPDIVLLRNGVIVPEGELLPNTDYEIEATIWNNSFDAPIVGLKVNFGFLSFGAGMVLHPIGTKVVNLGVKGGINHPAKARIGWKTPPTAGHYCIQVELNWIDDVNPANNLGQNNVNVVSPQSPATFKFQLRNNSGLRRKYTFPIDTYVLPTLKDCEKKIKKRSNEQKWKEIQDLHNRGRYMVPPDWTVTVSPVTVTLSTEQEVSIEVTIVAPVNFSGRKAFNVHAYADNGIYAGGVTVYVMKT